MIEKLRQTFTKYYDNASLRSKLFISYFLLTIIPFGLLASVYNIRTTIKLEEQAIYSAKQVFEQTKAYLEYKISHIVEISDIIVMNNELQEVLKRDFTSYSNDFGQQNLDMVNMGLYFQSIQKSSDINQIRLYVRSDLMYSDENYNFFNSNTAANSTWFERLQLHKDKILWSPSYYFADEDNPINVISAVRKIRDIDSLTNTIGIIRLDIPEEDIRSILNKSKSTSTSIAFLLNSKSEVVCISDTMMANTEGIINDIVQQFSSEVSGNSWHNIQSVGQKIMVGREDIENTDWSILVAIPYNDILSISNVIKQEILVIMVIIILMAYSLAYFISYSSTKRISKLIDQMRKVENADFNISILPHSKDEIGELTKNFNYMLTKIAILVEEKYELGREIKNAELKALQAQINPHFLYNTLDLINWLSLMKNASEIGSVVHSLSKFYKLSLSQGEDIVTIQNEIDHVKAYVSIQNKRFNDNLHLMISINEKLMQHKILKIILQPIVENAILHGILEKKEGRGFIEIVGNIVENEVSILIRDDGVGIPKNKLETIMYAPSSSSGQGYGIRNINERIKLYYGSKYGLSFESELGKGTTVKIRIPAVSAPSKSKRLKL